MATLVEDHVVVEEHFMEPSAEYPDGSYMRRIGGEVDIATGHYAVKHPGKPSLDWHGKPPYCFLGWDRTPEKESEKEILLTSNPRIKEV